MRRVVPFAALLSATALLTCPVMAQAQTIFQQRKGTFQTNRPAFQTPRATFQTPRALLQTPRATFQTPRAPFQTPGLGGTMWGNNPWFSNQGARTELNLSADQFNQLRQAYDTHYNNYQQDLGRLTESERALQDQQMQNAFFTNFGKAASDVLNQQQINRWQQLELQYQGYNAFSAPQIRDPLNLLDTQVQQLNKFGQQYYQALDDINKSAQTDPAAASRRYDALNKLNLENMNSVLTPGQQQLWSQMTGEPFAIPPAFGTTSAPGTPKQ
jgi:hypothetical protein